MQDEIKNPGAIKDTPDVRDYHYQGVAAGSAPFDWSKGFDVEEVLSAKLKIPGFKIPWKDQNGSFSCGGQAWSYFMQVIEAIATGTFEERSSKYIYAQTFVPPGGGSSGRTNSDLCVDQGDCRETVLSSYENGQPPSEEFMRRAIDITPEARVDAKKARALLFSIVENNIDALAQAIRDNNGVVIGISGSNNGTWWTVSPTPPSPGSVEWGHWLYLGKAKLVNGEKKVGALNSWGEKVGEKGWQWFGDKYFASGFIWYGWTLSYRDTDPQLFKYEFKKNLKLGMPSSTEVNTLQKALQALKNSLGISYMVPGVFGPFGPQTKTALGLFQTDHGIKDPDGQGTNFGPKTRETINKELENGN